MTDRLRDLELRLAAARPGHETELVEEAARILAGETAYRVRRFVNADAFADAALLVYRAAIPDSGLQFGLGRDWAIARAAPAHSSGSGATRRRCLISRRHRHWHCCARR